LSSHQETQKAKNTYGQNSFFLEVKVGIDPWHHHENKSKGKKPPPQQKQQQQQEAQEVTESTHSPDDRLEPLCRVVQESRASNLSFPSTCCAPASDGGTVEQEKKKITNLHSNITL
jgi:hypothetical protein